MRACIASVGLLGGCATTDTVSRGELSELMASVRALRADNARLEARLDKLEQDKAVTATKRTSALSATATSGATAPPAAPPPATPAVPPLTVVKLKPRVQQAPPLDTGIEVAEPSPALRELRTAVDPVEAEADLALSEAAYQKGLDALKTGSAEQGMTLLLQFAADNPRHPHADNALYYVGVAQMAQQEFAGAASLFERVIAVYPAGDSVVDALLKLGECRAHLKQPAQARAAWEKVVSGYPGTPGSAKAQANLAGLSSSKGL